VGTPPRPCAGVEAGWAGMGPSWGLATSGLLGQLIAPLRWLGFEITRKKTHPGAAGLVMSGVRAVPCSDPVQVGML